MKHYQYLISIILLFTLSACGGSSPASDDTSSSSILEPTETSSAIAEANDDASSDNQAEQPVVDSASENTQTESNIDTAIANGNCYNEYYPVSNGATWTYAMDSALTGADSFNRSVISVSENGFTDQDLFSAGTTRTGTWTCDNGNLTALSLGGLASVSNSQQTFVATSQESSGITYPSPLNTGGSWSQHLVISGDMVIAEGMSGTATADATQSCTAVGEESITVSAGSFETMKLNCSTSISVTVDIDGITIDPVTINSTSEVWMASGVGMVKTIDNNDLTDVTIELTGYAIP